MTEQEWLTATDPKPMLQFLKGKASDRKLRLFLIACSLRTFADAPWEEITDAIPAVEMFIEKAISPADFAPAKDAINWGIWEMCESLNLRAEALLVAIQEQDVSAELANHTVKRALDGWRMNVPDLDIVKEHLAVCHIARDIFGNSFRPVVIKPSWLTSTVVTLATGIYQEKAFDRIPILAGTLQDAGCDNDEILTHCRGPGPHVRGCFLIDLLLGKE